MSVQHDEDYLSVLRDVVDNGYLKADRTGVGTRSRFGVLRRFDIRDGKIPLLTTKEVKHKSWRVENKWFLSGSGKVGYLLANGVRIWNNWIKKGSEVFRKLSPQERLLHSKLSKEEREKVEDDIVKSIDPMLPSGNRALLLEKALTTKADELGAPTQVLEDADLGPVYGMQWRFWEGTRIIPIEDGATAGVLLERGYEFMGNLIDPATDTEKLAVYHRKFDQIAAALKLLREDPDSRRIIVSAWNPDVLADQALPPCHTLFQFWTRELTLEERFEAGTYSIRNAQRWDELGSKEWMVQEFITWKPAWSWNVMAGYGVTEGDTEKAHMVLDRCGVPRRALSCMLYQRSADVPIGIPFNIAQYATLTHMFARCVNMMADEFIWVAADHHVYNDQVELAKEQLSRSATGAEPRVLIHPEAKCTDPMSFGLSDIKIHGYEKGDFHPFIPYPVAV